MPKSFNLRLGLVTLNAVAVLSSTVSSAVYAHQPTRPVELDISEQQSKQGVVSEGVSLIVQLQIQERFQGGQATIKVERLGKAAYENQTVEQGERSVKRDEKELKIDLKIREQGRYKATILLEGMEDEQNGFSSKIIRYVQIDARGRYRILDAQELFDEDHGARQQRFKRALANNPDDPDLRVLSPDLVSVPNEISEKARRGNPETYINARPAALSIKEQRYLQLNSDKSWAPQDPITVRGRMVFTDWDGVVKPLVNATIDVYDDDTLGDEHLAAMATDWNGEWSVSLNNDDGWLQNGRDIYYKVKTSNSRFQVKNCGVFGSVYDWKSEVFDDRNEGAIVDFGTDTVSTNNDATIVFNMMNDGWNHSVQVGGRDPGFVKTCFPEDATNWSRFWENINFEDDFIDGPNVLHHEYAHAIFWYGQGEENASPGGSHSFADVNQDPGLAWSEGWANAFQHSVRPDGVFNWNEGSAGESLESYRFNNANRDGNLNEGRVTAALIDMMDGNNDTNGGNQGRGRDEYGDDNNANRVPLETILNDSIWGNYHDDFDDFWGTLSGNLTVAQRTDAQEIMYYNWMNVPEPITCVATKVAATETDKPEEFLAGLRDFRDYGLGQFGGGRRIIQDYYSNSPEIGLRLLRDPKLRREAFEIAEQFSQLGKTLVSNERLKEFARNDRAVIDAELAKRVRTLLAALGEKASPELQSVMQRSTQVLNSLEGFGYAAVRDRIAQGEGERPEHSKVSLRQWDLTPASKEAAQDPELRQILKPIEAPKDLK